MAFVEVPGVDWAEALLYPPGKELESWSERTWETVLAFVRREHSSKPLDFFLCYLYPQQVEVAAIAELQRMGIPCVNFFCDNVREFQRIPPEFQPFALHWVPEFEALPLYQRAGLPHIHAPMPCWVPPELRNGSVIESEPPTFVGSADVLRRAILGRALELGGDFVVRGRGWQTNEIVSRETAGYRGAGQIFLNQLSLVRQYGMATLCYKLEKRFFPLSSPPVLDVHIKEPPIGGGEYFRVTREALITIGVNRVSTARRSDRDPLTYSRLRDLEAPMLAACYLTEWTEGLGLLYDIGTEIETYRTPEELCSKLSELKENPIRRRQLRELGQKRALADHSVARSLGSIKEKLGLK